MARVLDRQFCQLQSSCAQSSPQGSLPPSVLGRGISTPLRAEAWERALADHPHKEWVSALLRGMRQGFRIGLRSSARCRSSAVSRPSARAHSQVVDEFLQQQVTAGFMIGPLEPQECSGVVTSSVGVVPKSTPGKFRVIVDLSRPEGASVNDQLLRELTHVAYSSIEDASFAMHTLGPGAQLAKIDIRDAYRIIPVHPEDRPFLGTLRSWGCGAWMLPVWLQVPWPADHCLSSIALKELAPVVFAAAAWGERWRGQFILCHSDNTAVVAQLNSLHARDPLACNMLRCLAFWQALYDFRLRAVHIAGALNTGADLFLATSA